MFLVNPLKNQALFSSKDKSKILKYRLLHVCLALVRVKSSNDRPEPAMTPDEHFTWIYTVCPLCFDFSVENTLFLFCRR